MDLKLFNEFIKKPEADQIISYINNNLNEFQSFQDNKYFIKMFGKDNYFKSSIDLNETKEIKDLIIKYFEKCVNKIKNAYKYDSELFINSFWLTKQTNGAYLELHGDNDLGKNTQFMYSCGIYLNDVLKDGTLHFPNLKYIYQPNCGDLICWPSQNLNYDHEINKISDDRYAMLLWLTNDKNYALEY